MREYRISVDGKLHKVKILRIVKDTSFLFEVDDETYEVDLAKEFRNGSPISMRVRGRPIKVELSEVNEKAPYSIRINGKSFKVQHEVAERIAPKTMEPTPPTLLREVSKEFIAEEGAVTAPMPGIVISLKVNVGDNVKAGDGLFILEAMKMENEITSQKDGVVKEIRVSERASVRKGETMAIIK